MTATESHLTPFTNTSLRLQASDFESAADGKLTSQDAACEKAVGRFCVAKKSSPNLTFKDTQLNVEGDKKENERTFDVKHVFSFEISLTCNR